MNEKYDVAVIGSGSGGLNLYSTPTAPTKIDSGQVDSASRDRAPGGDPPRKDRVGHCEFQKVTTPESDQQTILDYLKVRLYP